MLRCMILRWMSNVRREDKILTVNLQNRLQLNTMRECLRNGRLQLFGHLEIINEGSWPNKFQKVKVGGSLGRRQLMKTKSEVKKNET